MVIFSFVCTSIAPFWDLVDSSFVSFFLFCLYLRLLF
jgi:hypothetical protein